MICKTLGIDEEKKVYSKVLDEREPSIASNFITRFRVDRYHVCRLIWEIVILFQAMN